MRFVFLAAAAFLSSALFGNQQEAIHLFRSDFQNQTFLTISYTYPAQTAQQGTLKEFWHASLFHSLVQQRLQRALAQSGVAAAFHQQGLPSSKGCAISISCPTAQAVAALSCLCNQMEWIKKRGFSEKECQQAKDQAYAGLLKWEESRVQEVACLVSNPMDAERLNLKALVESSKDLLEMASLSEVSEFSRAQMIEASREVDIVVPSDETFISEAELRQILDEQKWIAEQQLSSVGTTELSEALHDSLLAPHLEEETLEEARPQLEEVRVTFISNEIQESAPAIAMSETNNAAIDYYAQLPISYEERRMLAKIIVTVAENNVLKLLFEKKKLEKLGKKINHVHPMRFVGTILSDQRLHHCLKEIRKNTFKWEGFMEGVVRRMNEECDRDNVRQYIPGFAASLGVNPSQITPYIERRDFEGLVLSLL